MSIAVPRLFHFPQLATWYSLLCMMLPYTLACLFFGMMVSCTVKYRENVMLIVVFMSVPLLFLTGVSWPQTCIPGCWQGVSWLFPSTFGARAYIRLNSMGANVSDVMPEIRILWIQTVCYFAMTLCVYRFQFFVARHYAMERRNRMRLLGVCRTLRRPRHLGIFKHSVAHHARDNSTRPRTRRCTTGRTRPATQSRHIPTKIELIQLIGAQ